MSHAHTHAPRRPQVPLGLWGTVRSIAQTEGIVGFYRGLGPTVLQILPYTGLMYYSYELAKVAVRAVTTSAPARGLVGPGDPGWITRDVEKLVSGSVAGLMLAAAILLTVIAALWTLGASVFGFLRLLANAPIGHRPAE